MTNSSMEAIAVSEQSVQAVERREWWPHELVDEEMPAGREAPDAWLARYGLSERYVVDECEPKALNEGDIAKFIACDALGSALLTFDGNRKPLWTPPIPAEVDHLWDGEDIIAESPDDFAEQVFESSVRGHIEGETFVAILSRWPGDALRFRFTALDGPPRFVPLDPIPEPPGVFLTPPADPQTDLFVAPESAR